MAAAGFDQASKELGEQTKRFERFYEAQMEAIGLSEEQLREQGLFELRDSLETVNDAISNPQSFGSLNPTGRSLCRDSPSQPCRSARRASPAVLEPAQKLLTHECVPLRISSSEKV